MQTSFFSLREYASNDLQASNVVLYVGARLLRPQPQKDCIGVAALTANVKTDDVMCGTRKANYSLLRVCLTRICLGLQKL